MYENVCFVCIRAINSRCSVAVLHIVGRRGREGVAPIEPLQGDSVGPYNDCGIAGSYTLETWSDADPRPVEVIPPCPGKKQPLEPAAGLHARGLRRPKAPLGQESITSTGHGSASDQVLSSAEPTMQKPLYGATYPPSNGSMDSETIIFPEQMQFYSASRAYANLFHGTDIMHDSM